MAPMFQTPTPKYIKNKGVVDCVESAIFGVSQINYPDKIQKRKHKTKGKKVKSINVEYPRTRISFFNQKKKSNKTCII